MSFILLNEYSTREEIQLNIDAIVYYRINYNSEKDPIGTLIVTKYGTIQVIQMKWQIDGALTNLTQFVTIES